MPVHRTDCPVQVWKLIAVILRSSVKKSKASMKTNIWCKKLCLLCTLSLFPFFLNKQNVLITIKERWGEKLRSKCCSGSPRTWKWKLEPGTFPSSPTTVPQNLLKLLLKLRTDRGTEGQTDRQIDRHFFSTMLGGRNDLYAGGIIISMWLRAEG